MTATATAISQRLTRSYCAERLLALGPLTMRDFCAITGWPEREAKDVIAELSRAKVVTYRHSVNQSAPGRQYCLVDGAL